MNSFQFPSVQIHFCGIVVGIVVGCPSIWISPDAEIPTSPQGGECGV